MLNHLFFKNSRNVGTFESPKTFIKNTSVRNQKPERLYLKDLLKLKTSETQNGFLSHPNEGINYLKPYLKSVNNYNIFKLRYNLRFKKLFEYKRKKSFKKQKLSNSTSFNFLKNLVESKNPSTTFKEKVITNFFSVKKQKHYLDSM